MSEYHDDVLIIWNLIDKQNLSYQLTCVCIGTDFIYVNKEFQLLKKMKEVDLKSIGELELNKKIKGEYNV